MLRLWGTQLWSCVGVQLGLGSTEAPKKSCVPEGRRWVVKEAGMMERWSCLSERQGVHECWGKAFFRFQESFPVDGGRLAGLVSVPQE